MTLGIDLGGTNLCLGLVDNGNVINSISVPSFSPDWTVEETLEYLSVQIEKLLTPETERIGIGVPSVVDVKKGIVYEAANIPSWKEVHLKEYLETRFNIPANVNNDANCYAMGAYGKYPEDAKPEVLVGITLGTGLGVGIVHEGKLFCGANCGAGELGYLAYGKSNLEEHCSKQFFFGTGWESIEAAQAAQAGDEKAIALFNEFGRHLGHAICTFLYAYDPSHIVLGGGIAHAMPLFRDSMYAYMRENFPFGNILNNLKIDVMTDGNIHLIGASLI